MACRLERQLESARGMVLALESDLRNPPVEEIERTRASIAHLMARLERLERSPEVLRGKLADARRRVAEVLGRIKRKEQDENLEKLRELYGKLERTTR